MRYAVVAIVLFFVAMAGPSTAAQTYSSDYDENTGYYMPLDDGSCEPGMGFVPETEAGYGGAPMCSPEFFEEILNDTGFDEDGNPTYTPVDCEDWETPYEGLCVPNFAYPTNLECLASPWPSPEVRPSGVMTTLFGGAAVTLLFDSDVQGWHYIRTQDGFECFISSQGLNQLLVIYPVADSSGYQPNPPDAGGGDQEVVELIVALPTTGSGSSLIEKG